MGLAKKTVLFLCYANSCRSQMAEALCRARAPEKVVCMSAGAEPAESVHPQALAVLQEIGVSARGQKPKQVSQALLEKADVIVRLCSPDSCVVARPDVRDWLIPNPIGLPLSHFRAVRDEIAEKIDELLAALRKN